MTGSQIAARGKVGKIQSAGVASNGRVYQFGLVRISIFLKIVWINAKEYISQIITVEDSDGIR